MIRKRRSVGYAGVTSPGNAPSAITVGAFKTKTRSRAATTDRAYSSRGPTWYDGFRQARPGCARHSLVRLACDHAYLYQKLSDQPAHAQHGKPI